MLAKGILSCLLLLGKFGLKFIFWQYVWYLQSWYNCV